MARQDISPSQRKYAKDIINGYVENTKCKDCNIKALCNAIETIRGKQFCYTITELLYGLEEF